jgi:hypothetical protein
MLFYFYFWLISLATKSRMKSNSKKCEYCGCNFISKRSDALFCCNSHRQLSYLNYWSKKSAKPIIQEVYYPKDKKEQMDKFVFLKLKYEISNAYLKKQNEELRGILEKTMVALDNFEIHNNLMRISTSVLKIIEKLLKYDEENKISKQRIEGVIFDLNFLIDSITFKNAEERFVHTSFLKQILLPNMESEYYFIKNEPAYNHEYQIPQEIKKKLLSIYQELS